jgi:CRP-like cAMP-binding protein
MYVLLTGALSVMRNKVEIATISPVTTVGEMGVVTGEVRTASLVAKASSRLLVIRKIELDSMMRRDIDLGLTIFKNFATTLSQRLATTNVQLDRLRKENEQLKQQIAEYEKKTRER